MKLPKWKLKLMKDLIKGKVTLVKTRMGYQYKTKTKIMDKENIVNIIENLFKSGYISIRVDIKTEHAKYGDGKWNKTQTFLRVGDELIPLEEGDVEIV